MGVEQVSIKGFREDSFGMTCAEVDIPSKLRSLLMCESKLYESAIHGLKHWRQVHKNGLYLCQFCDADVEIVTYFAYLHDCMRKNEWGDPKHGRRGAEYAEGIRTIFI